MSWLKQKEITRPDGAKWTAIETLRHISSAFDYCNETLLQRYTIEELLKIYDAWMRSEWDFYPDQWTTRQLGDAIKKGRAPTWSDSEEPTYG